MSKSYRNYVLLLLMIVYIFNFIDRQILVILQESIKMELGLSDKQLGLLSGFSFAVFYVVCGIPIARLADRYNRVNIVSASLAIWSAMTALSGLAGNFFHLLAARIGVGVGEAGASPPSHSIISDYFPHEERGRALSIYSIGIYIGILIGFLAGGWINQYFGWRTAFLVVGGPGILLAIVVKLTLREPLRGHLDAGDHESMPDGEFLPDVKRIWALRSFRYAAIGAGLNAFLGYGALNFMPSFAIRLHEVPVGMVGTWLALIVGLAGAAGVYSGGHLSDHLGKRDQRWAYWIAGIQHDPRRAAARAGVACRQSIRHVGLLCIRHAVIVDVPGPDNRDGTCPGRAALPRARLVAAVLRSQYHRIRSRAADGWSGQRRAGAIAGCRVDSMGDHDDEYCGDSRWWPVPGGRPIRAR